MAENGAPEKSVVASASVTLRAPLRLHASASAAAQQMKLPSRRVEASRDAQLRQRCFSPWAVAQWRESVARNSVDGRHCVEKLRLFDMTEKFRRQMAAEGEYQNQRSDFTLLAKSSARSQEATREMMNHLRNGITEDNMGNYARAIEHFQKLLHISRKTGDKAFLAIALNHIGVDSMYLVSTPKDIALESPFVREEVAGAQATSPALSQEHLDLVNKAVEYFEEHRAIADDAGEFVARTNLGICADMLSDFDAAAQHHQEALRIAIRIQSVHAQAIAVGNLGILARVQGDLNTALACMEQYLALVQTLKDPVAEIGAWMQLGALHAAQEDTQKALDNFTHAQEIALREGEVASAKRINCNIAIVAATDKMGEHFASLRQRI